MISYRDNTHITCPKCHHCHDPDDHPFPKDGHPYLNFDCTACGSKLTVAIVVEPVYVAMITQAGSVSTHKGWLEER